MRSRVIIMLVLAVLLVGAGSYLGYLYFDQPSSAKATASTSTKTAAASEKTAPSKAAAADAGTSAAPDTAPAKEAKLPAILGTAGDDTIKGTDAAERIYAADVADPQGKDTIDAGGGDDKIYVDAGDTAQGGPGHDELIVRGAKGMTFALAGSGIEETWGGDGNDVFDGTGVTDQPLTLRGGDGNDTLTGGSLGDTLFGGAGDDMLAGGPGDDVLKGNEGTDTLTGGPGADFFNPGKFDGSSDVVTDYNFADGDTVLAASFSVHGKDTWLLDDAGNTLLILKNYDAQTSGVARRK